jgi:uncharacterized protein YbjQ (UPF0145 family)
MADLIAIVLSLSVFFILLMVGWLAGRAAEQRHFADLARREQALASIPVTTLRMFPGPADVSYPACLVGGEVAIASDYMKRFLASLKKIIGGRLTSYETLLDRARREAQLRMLEQAVSLGYNAVCNVRIQTVDIGGELSPQKKQNVLVAIVVWGTAYRLNAPATH